MDTATYSAPAWLPGGHLQTLYPALFLRGDRLAYRRERWELADGDFLDTDWVDAAEAPLLVLFHGLEGNSASPYARNLMQAVHDQGWRGVVVNFRGCSGEPTRLPRAYFVLYALRSTLIKMFFLLEASLLPLVRV